MIFDATTMFDDPNAQAQLGPPVADADSEAVIVQPRSNSRDGADRLPAEARRRLLDLRQQQSDTFAAYRAASDRVQVLSEQRRDAERRLRRVRDPEQNAGRRTPEDSAPIRELIGQIENLSAELDRLREVMEVRGARSNQAGALVQNVERFVKNLPEHARIVTAPSVSARPVKGEDLTAAVERRRARLRELDADAHRAKSAPLPSADAKRLAREQIDKFVARGAVNVAPLLEGGGPFRFAEAYQNIVVEGADGRAVGTHWGVDVEATLAWVFRDQFVAKIEAEIDAVSDDGSALSTEARAAKLTEIEGDKLICAREEEELIRCAEKNGLAIARRADADARAVLGIVIEGAK